MRPYSRGNKDRFMSRRQWMSMLGIGGTAAIAGCLGDDDADDTAPADDSDDTDPGDDSAGEDPGDDSDDHEPPELDELPEPEGTYTTVQGSSFTTLNPIYNSEAGAGTAIGRALDQGFTFAPGGELIPLLYDLNTDDGGEVWVFDLRDNLEFSDPYGQVTADDFVYQIQELHQSEWAATVSQADWQGVNVEVTGDLQFQAELPTAQLLWPESFDPLLYPIPQDLVEPYVAEEDTEGLQQDDELLELTFSGNLGAYKLDHWERNAGTRYSRNEDYYMRAHTEDNDLFENAPYFEESRIEVIEEEASRLGALQAGEADGVAIPPERVAEFQQDPDVEVYISPQPYNEVIAVNMRDNGWNAGPGNMFQIKEFRQAMAAAIDKNQIVEGVFRGYATPHFTWQPEWSRWYPEDRDIPEFGMGDMYGQDVAMGLAEEAFAQSDYDYGFDGDTMVNPDGDQVELVWYYNPGNETRALIAQVAAQELEQNLGMEIDVQAMDPIQYDQQMFRTPSDGEPTYDEDLDMEWDSGAFNAGPRSVTSEEPWDMSNVYGLNTYPMNPLTTDAFFDGPDAFFNATGYYPEFDASGLLEQGRAAETEEELKDIMGDYFYHLADEQPWILLAFDDSTVGYGKDIVGPTETFHSWPASTFYRE